jgi:type I restriction enzyme S subunit
VTRIGGCINDGSVALLGLNETDRHYLYYYLSAQTDRLRSMNQGAAQPNLNTSIVRSIPVPWAPEAERRELCAVVASRLAALQGISDALQGLNERSSTLDTALLNKAFRGELVAQVSDDEPAAALIARLRAERATAPVVRRARGVTTPA